MREPACIAIIAVNARARCKTRLAGLLGVDGRVALARAMLARVLAAARATPAVDAVLVVSPERDRVPRDVPVIEDGGVGLNEAMEAGRREARGRGAISLLLLPADLPLLRPADLDRLARTAGQGGVAIAPDRRGLGTNGLYLPAAATFDFRYGPGSRAWHEAEARRRGLPVRRVVARGLRADLDTAEDVPVVLVDPGARTGFGMAASAS